MVESGRNPKMQGTLKPRGWGFCCVRSGVARAKMLSAKARQGLWLSNPAPGGSRIVLLVTLSRRTRWNTNRIGATTGSHRSHFKFSSIHILKKSQAAAQEGGCFCPTRDPRATSHHPVPPLATFPSPLPQRGSLGAPDGGSQHFGDRRSKQTWCRSHVRNEPGSLGSHVSEQVQRHGAVELGGLPPAADADGGAAPAIMGSRRMNTVDQFRPVGASSRLVCSPWCRPGGSGRLLLLGRTYQRGKPSQKKQTRRVTAPRWPPWSTWIQPGLKLHLEIFNYIHCVSFLT